MPKKPSRPCPGYGARRGSCPNLVKGGDRYCIECEPYVKADNRKYDKERDQTPERQFLHSTKWRRIRDHKLAIDPLCERCQNQGLTVPAVLVHHVDRNELNNHHMNLESLCNFCHETEHWGERWRK